MNDKPLKNIYKKSLAIELIKLGHDLNHSMRNRNNSRYQVFSFHHTEQLDRDLARLSNKPYTPHN